VDIAEEVPELAGEIRRVVRVNGKKALELRTGERYKVQAANRRGGRGLSGDLVILDELREHQSWDAWAAVTKTTLARVLAQIWAFSNAGDASSIVLAHLRRMAHAALGDPDGINAGPGAKPAPADDDGGDLDQDSLGIFEWSTHPGVEPRDRGGWPAANPALGHTVTERALASALRTDPDWVFRTEVLCQWSAGTLEGPFPAGAWEACLDPVSSIGDAETYVVGLDVSHDRAVTHAAVAEFDQHGRPHPEVNASRAGTDWVLPWLQERRAKIRVVAGQGRGAPVSDLLDEVEAAGFEVRRWEGDDLPAGTGQFYDLVRDRLLSRIAQPLLDVAVATAASKPLGDRFVWNRRQSPADIAPLIAANAAVWALLAAPVPTVSAYETRNLMVL
jgi:hypothetical protein